MPEQQYPISDGHEARAYVTHDLAYRGVAIHLAQYTVAGPRLALPTEVMMADDDGSTFSAPWLRLPDAIARALLEALAEHYGGVAGVRALRADYDHERQRVDRLIGTLQTISTATGTL